MRDRLLEISVIEGAGRGGERRRRGCLLGEARSRPPCARWSGTFGSYKARTADPICLHNYSDFLLSETTTGRIPT
ncbi:hypothetical protein GCM10017752_19470 [Streptomyces roseoviridis]